MLIKLESKSVPFKGEKKKKRMYSKNNFQCEKAETCSFDKAELEEKISLLTLS